MKRIWQMARPRNLAMAFLALGLSLPGMVGAEGVKVSHAKRCRLSGPVGESQGFACTLPGGVAGRLLFRATLGGSHDDTTGELTLTLDGKPVACGEGSKTTTEGEFGEDGVVVLACRFLLPRSSAQGRDLRAMLKLHHAQYQGFELLSD